MRRPFRICAVIALAALAACAGTVREPATPAPPSVPAPEVQQPLSSIPSGTTGKPAPPVFPPQPAAPAPQAPPAAESVYQETGLAGWYGEDLHGRKTASGEFSHEEGLTASHRTLPLGTVIRVTNLDNSKSADVKITDRGPFVKNRMLDLSSGAARELGFLASGTARVKIETLGPVPNKARYTVQAATYTEEENARLLKERLSKKFELVYIVQAQTPVARVFHVRIGSYASEERAGQIAGKLTLEGLEPVVLRKD